MKITNENELSYSLHELTSVLNELLGMKENKLQDDYYDLKTEFEKLERFAKENKELYDKYLIKLEEEEKAAYIPF